MKMRFRQEVRTENVSMLMYNNDILVYNNYNTTFLHLKCGLVKYLENNVSK